MRRIKIEIVAPVLLLVLALASGLALFSTAFAPAARADDFHLTTVLTFDRPVQLPGDRVLPPGTYQFELFDPENDLDVVAIYDVGTSHIEALLDTQPSFRYHPTDRAQVTVARQDDTMPDVLVRIFFPNREWGFNFIYSRQMQRRLDREMQLTMLVPAGSPIQ